ncbi:hypothetical protein ACLK17_25800 [Escherichia coli]
MFSPFTHRMVEPGVNCVPDGSTGIR